MLRSPKTKNKENENAASVLDLSIDEMISMAQLELRDAAKRPSGSHRLGDWRDRRRGRGLELESIGPYQSGDDVRHIDWNSSARIGQPQVKRFYTEIQWTLVVVIDLRPSMFFGTQVQLMAKTACLGAARIAFGRPSHQSVGFVLVGNTRAAVLTPRRGRVARLRRLNDIVDAYKLERDAAFETVCPLDDALAGVGEKLPRNAELVLLSDMSFPGDNLTGALAGLGRSRITAVVVEDAMSRHRPPRGRYPMKLAGESQAFTVSLGRLSAAQQDAYGRSAKMERLRLNAHLRAAGINDVSFLTSADLARGSL